MLNLQTGEITLPELVLHPGITLDEVLKALDGKLKTTELYRESEDTGEDEFYGTSVFFVEPPEVLPQFKLQGIDFDYEGRIDRYILTPTDVPDDEPWDPACDDAAYERLEAIMQEAGAVDFESVKHDVRYEYGVGDWCFPWGTIDASCFPCVDVYFKRLKDFIHFQPNEDTYISAAYDEINADGTLTEIGIQTRLLPIVNRLLNTGYTIQCGPIDELGVCDGEFVNVTYKLPHGALGQFFKNNRQYYCAFPEGYQGKKYGIVANEHHLVIFEIHPDDYPEVLLWTKWI